MSMIILVFLLIICIEGLCLVDNFKYLLIVKLNFNHIWDTIVIMIRNNFNKKKIGVLRTHLSWGLICPNCGYQYEADIVNRMFMFLPIVRPS